MFFPEGSVVSPATWRKRGSRWWWARKVTRGPRRKSDRCGVVRGFHPLAGPDQQEAWLFDLQFPPAVGDSDTDFVMCQEDKKEGRVLHLGLKPGRLFLHINLV